LRRKGALPVQENGGLRRSAVRRVAITRSTVLTITLPGIRAAAVPPLDESCRAASDEDR